MATLDQWPWGFEEQNLTDSTGDHQTGCFVFSSQLTITKSCIPWSGLRHAGTINKCHISTSTRGAFDVVFILTVWPDAQHDVGDDERGGHHNKT